MEETEQKERILFGTRVKCGMSELGKQFSQIPKLYKYLGIDSKGRTPTARFYEVNMTEKIFDTQIGIFLTEEEAKNLNEEDFTKEGFSKSIFPEGKYMTFMYEVIFNIYIGEI
jgi:hypothetical protein